MFYAMPTIKSTALLAARQREEKMYSLITFATQWGSKHGGINSFNTDFLTAFGVAYHLQAQVICIVASATPEETEEARNAHVTLVPLPYPPQDKLFSTAQAQAGIDELKSRAISFNSDRTIWLGHDRISGAAANAAARIAGGQSALIHHMSYKHYESYAENSCTSYQKYQDQKVLFQQADLALAVGPLLRDALIDLVGASKTVHMVIPGLAEIEAKPTPKTFTAFLSGRLTDDAARIKQVHLGIAAFSQAHREARDIEMPDGLCQKPMLVLRGVDFESTASSPQPQEIDPEVELKIFAQDYAKCVINLQALPYTQNRQELYEQLSASSVALMPSWHEGFGLVGWEAIAAGVPLIISKDSGVYYLLDEELGGVGTGAVFGIDVDGKVEHPFFSEDDLNCVSDSLKTIAHKIDKARKQAGILRNLVGNYSWTACAEKAAEIFGWPLQKGGIPAALPVQVTAAPIVPITSAVPSTTSPLHIPSKRWQAGSAIADSQLLRAEEALVPFDTARQPDLDTLNFWLDDTKHPQAVRLITGAGGLGKTRLGLELCQQRLKSGWHAGLLDNDLEAKDMTAAWQVLRYYNQPLLIVIDYAETRQASLLALLKAMLQAPSTQPVRLLLLARDGGEWWDNLPGKDKDCESFLGGYATSGPYHLSELHTEIQDRRQAYQLALQSFAMALGAPIPNVVPELVGEHFGRPLYLQMAALLALHGERPTTAPGLTKALLNHERRYWGRSLIGTVLPEPEKYAEQLLALTTLAGGFPTPKSAQSYWSKASGNAIGAADFNQLFHALEPLYPGKQGLQAVRPDLLGEGLVAQALLRPSAADLLDSLLDNDASQSVRLHTLTVIARLSGQHHDLHETLVEALARHFAHCCHEIVAVATETSGALPSLTEGAFSRLTLSAKSQIAGLLRSHVNEESVQLVKLYCLIEESLADKYRHKYQKKPNDLEQMYNYAVALLNYSISLKWAGSNLEALSKALECHKLSQQLFRLNPQRFASIYASSLSSYAVRLDDEGQYEEALKYAQEALELDQRLAQKNPNKHEPAYATSLSNYASYLSNSGQNEEALEYARQALEIRQRLVQKNLDKHESDYATSLSNYASHLDDVGKNKEALIHAEQALEICRRLAQKKPDRHEPSYAISLGNYANYLSEVSQDKEALEYARQALEILQRLVQKNPDRYEPDYAMSLNNYAGHLSNAAQYEEALEYARQAQKLYQRFTQKNPDRYESEYAMSLDNYASRLSDAGQDEEALIHAQNALEICQRLAQKNPGRFAEDMFTSSCVTHFLRWLNSSVGKSIDWVDLCEIPATTPHHRRLPQLLYKVFVQACQASKNQATRAEAFKKVITIWHDLSQENRATVQDFYLCAAAWCALYEPSVVESSDWQASWHQYINRKNGRLPYWMQKVAQRLEFQWPE
jgi:tetratricopeptide (TPR) repeat protein